LPRIPRIHCKNKLFFTKFQKNEEKNHHYSLMGSGDTKITYTMIHA